MIKSLIKETSSKIRLDSQRLYEKFSNLYKLIKYENKIKPID